MLAKEFKAIKKVPGFVNEVRAASAAGWCQAMITHALSCTQGPHCSFVAQQGWSTKYPALGCHKRAFALRDLVSSWSLSTCGRDVSSRRSILTADAPPSSARSSWHRRSSGRRLIWLPWPRRARRMEYRTSWRCSCGSKSRPKIASAEPHLSGPAHPKLSHVYLLRTHQIFTSRDSLI